MLIWVGYYSSVKARYSACQELQVSSVIFIGTLQLSMHSIRVGILTIRFPGHVDVLPCTQQLPAAENYTVLVEIRFSVMFPIQPEGVVMFTSLDMLNNAKEHFLKRFVISYIYCNCS